MNIEIIKAESQEYQAGDVLTLGNPYEVKYYLLVDHINGDSLGAVNLTTATIECLGDVHNDFGMIVNEILKENEWNEWRLIPKSNVKMSLDCRNSSPVPKNNSF